MQQASKNVTGNEAKLKDRIKKLQQKVYDLESNMEVVVKIKNQESMGEISKLEAVNTQLKKRVSIIEEQGAVKLTEVDTNNATASDAKVVKMKNQLKRQVDKYHELETHQEALVSEKTKELQNRISVLLVENQDFKALQISKLAANDDYEESRSISENSNSVEKQEKGKGNANFKSAKTMNILKENVEDDIELPAMGKVKKHESQPFEFESSGALKVDQQPKQISKRGSRNALNINVSIGDAKSKQKSSIQTNKEITISPCFGEFKREDDGTMTTGSDVILRPYKEAKEAPAGINIYQHDQSKSSLDSADMTSILKENSH